tara:strand:+ start:768 stop:1058 length:291 start_codon:yes stop_codon:yes gene_type:complete
MKLKIKASDKVHRRYLLIEGKIEDVKASVLDGVGTIGWAKAAPVFVSGGRVKDLDKGKIVLAIDRKALNDVRASFELSKRKVKIIKVSGTLKGLSK